MSAHDRERHRRRRWTWVVLCWLAFASPVITARAATPLWPGSTDAARRMLADSDTSPEVGVAIVASSDALPTAAASALLADAATSRARAVRRAAMQRCAVRQIKACLPAAVAQWRIGLDPDPASRAAYLAVLRLFVDGSVAALLVDGLHAPDPELRAAVALSLFGAVIPDAARSMIVSALTARAADQVPTVRAAVLPTLSSLDPTRSAAALLQGLDDPEPVVRASAATAVGRLGERQFAPRLLRMIEAPSTPDIAAAVLTALGRTPGPEVDLALLQYLESPPTHLSQPSIAWTLALRAPFRATTRDTLLELLDKPDVADLAFRTLAGNLTVDDQTEIRARLDAAARVRPSSRASLQALLEASRPWSSAGAASDTSSRLSAVAATASHPQASRALRVISAFEQPPRSRAQATLRLLRAMAFTPELSQTEALLWRFLASPSESSARPPHATTSAYRDLALAELVRWTTDPGRAPSTRCGALWALLRAADDRRTRRAAWDVARGHLAGGPAMRHCVALAPAMVDNEVARGASSRERAGLRQVRRVIFTRSLIDEDPRVRAAALLAGWILDSPDLDAALLRASQDPDPHVRQLAGVLSVTAPDPGDTGRSLSMVRPASATQRAVDGWLWVRLDQRVQPAPMSIPMPLLPHLPLVITPSHARPDVPPLDRLR